MIVRYSDITSNVIDMIAGKLIAGGIAVLPTSTVYGLSCRHDDENALGRIYRLKKRPAEMPCITLISDIVDLDPLIRKKTKLAAGLINKYWLSRNPVALTLVFNKNNSPEKETIAVRLDPLPLINEIIKRTGPLVSTSANISGVKTPLNRIGDVSEGILEGVDIAVDYETALSGIPSTIIDVTGEKPVFLREGELKQEDL
jgi:L-threonylcarbamoyladenylate synthase